MFRWVLCNKSYTLGKMGVKALRSHARRSKLHAELVALKMQSFRWEEHVEDVKVVNGPVVEPATPVIEATAPARKALFLVNDDSRKSEILYVLHMADSSTSFKSADYTSEFFEEMFFDSEVAGGYSCGRTKATNIVKYGLSDLLKNQMLLAAKRADFFVIGFDESMNVKTKTSQMDLYLRFWELVNSKKCP